MFLRTFAAFFASASLASAGTLYVDASATGVGDGSTWTDAFTSLQLALATSQSGDELWVAAGIYTPHASDASKSFVLKDGVGMYGGFAGGETSLGQRDWDANLTVLDGDLGQDDVVGSGLFWYVGWNRNTSNSGHVVRAENVGASTVLDGFQIEAGATGPSGTFAGHELMWGSGVYCVNADPVLRNLTFLHNESAWADGGAVYVLDGSPIIEDCHFLENYAYLGDGGGLAIAGASDPVVRNCEFARNIADAGGSNASGAGLFVHADTQIEIERCVFEDNRTKQFNPTTYTSYGGGMAASFNGVVVRDCVFRRNSAMFGGGLMTWGPTTVINSVFEGNEAIEVNRSITDNGGWGGAVMINSFSAKQLHMVNCTVAYNSGEKYAGVYVGQSATALIENSIVWGNVAAIPEIANGWKAALGGDFDLAYSCVQKIFLPHAPGEDPINPSKLPGCTQAAPLFVVPGTGGDQHLAAGSPCVDAGRIDMALSLLDNEGGGRNQDDPAADAGFGSAPLVDMGAHERGAQALVVDVDSISSSAGGLQHLDLDLGAGHAGDLYLLAGSLSGTTPGLALGALNVPLNVDAYTLMIIGQANTGPFLGTLGVLDGAGRGSAAIALPPGSLPGLSGLRADHAALVLTGTVVTAVTGTTPLVLAN